ncbi:MAG: hypothetical protein MUE30_18005 [Spirosomaceae bacterium]|jgi:hypothetical protein|nr:hypothetical protein [Spirosomataceae bacterium]
MTIVVSKDMSKDAVQDVLKGFKKDTKSLKKHFGKLKRSIDGLEYQKEVRNEWN